MEDQLKQTLKDRLEAVEFDISSLETEMNRLAVTTDRLLKRLNLQRKIRHGFEEALDGLNGLDAISAYAESNHV